MMEMFYVLTVLVISQGYASVNSSIVYILSNCINLELGKERVKEERELEAESPHVLREVQRRPLSLGGRVSRRLQGGPRAN